MLAIAHYVGVFLHVGSIFSPTDALYDYSSDCVVFVLSFWLSMYAIGLYQYEAYEDLQVLLLRLAVSFALGAVAIATLQFALKDLTLWRQTLLIAMVSGFLGVVFVRWLWSPLLRSPTFRRRVLVLGAGGNASRIAALASARIAKTFACVGFIPLENEAISVSPQLVLRAAEPLARLVDRYRIDEIVVASDNKHAPLPLDELLDVKLSGTPVFHCSTFFERQTGLIDLDSVDQSWLIFSSGFGGNRLERFAKRAFDFAVSAIFLIVTLPLLVLVALAVKLESHGPVFYRQERVGLYGKPFMLLKFRSMTTEAEKDGVPRWSVAGDHRITRVGAFLRRTRIDEIPQMLNVLAGDMSLVGPRPEREYFVANLTRQIPYYFERHRVKPGISGWAQINFPYGASVQDAKAKLQFDLYYIKNYSLILDFMIMLQTLRVVLWPDANR